MLNIDLEKSVEIHKRPLHSEKMTVWYIISEYGIIDPYFLENDAGASVAVTLDRCCLKPQLQIDIDTAWFQQDRTTSHTTRLPMAASCELFPWVRFLGMVISHGQTILET